MTPTPPCPVCKGSGRVQGVIHEGIFAGQPSVFKEPCLPCMGTGTVVPPVNWIDAFLRFG